MNLKSGIIEINGETFSPGYTFEDFKNSSLYYGQDGVRIIRLKEIVKLLENNYIVVTANLNCHKTAKSE